MVQDDVTEESQNVVNYLIGLFSICCYLSRGGFGLVANVGQDLVEIQKPHKIIYPDYTYILYSHLPIIVYYYV